MSTLHLTPSGDPQSPIGWCGIVGEGRGEGAREGRRKGGREGRGSQGRTEEGGKRGKDHPTYF